MKTNEITELYWGSMKKKINKYDLRNKENRIKLYMCNFYICKLIANFFSYCLSRIEKYNKECEETELRERLLNENPYYLLDSLATTI